MHVTGRLKVQKAKKGMMNLGVFRTHTEHHFPFYVFQNGSYEGPCYPVTDSILLHQQYLASFGCMAEVNLDWSILF